MGIICTILVSLTSRRTWKTTHLRSSDKTGQDLKVIKRGLIVSNVMPVNEWLRISAIVLLLTIPPVRSDGPNPVHLCVSSAGEGGVSLPIELPFKSCNPGLPALGVLISTIRTVRKVSGGCSQLHGLNDEVALGVIWKATLWSDYVEGKRVVRMVVHGSYHTSSVRGGCMMTVWYSSTVRMMMSKGLLTLQIGWVSLLLAIENITYEKWAEQRKSN
jgi:hypothetical protein